MVAFWIRTFAPLFWITTGMPYMLANAPASIVFVPVTTFTALLPVTTPPRFALLLVLNVSVPPRECSSLPRSAAGPNPSLSGASAVLPAPVAGLEAGAGREHSEAAHAVADATLE
ncbi:hypothetical protein GCM10025794_30550 [Massilia kyonggiensis]